MKIAYVTLHWPRVKNSGIGKKIQQQISAWQQAGHVVHHYMHHLSMASNDDLLNGSHYSYPCARTKIGIIKREFFRVKALKTLIHAVRAYKPDLIYLRWGMYAIPLQVLFRIAPVVIEINTNDVSEHKLLGQFLNLYNQATRWITLQNASGFIFTTNELAKASDFTKFKIPYVVISNGINLDKYMPLPAPKTKIPHLVYIGTPHMPWQGVEKLVTLAQRCEDIHIDIIGCDTIPNIDTLPHNLSLHGYLTKEQYEPILSKASAAIGTIALHRKGMQEASPLKVREYAAYGIPLILPYEDTDLHNLKLDTILQIPNTEENVRGYTKEIHDFLHLVQGKRLDQEIIRTAIDSVNKEKIRLQFFEKFLEKNF